MIIFVHVVQQWIGR